MEKSVSVGASTFQPFSKSGAPSSRQKFDKVEKLNTMINELSTPENNTHLPNKVLENIKEKIKGNYDNLYTNYQENKRNIIKKIEKTESSRGENALAGRFEQTLRQKAYYDKIKDEVQRKQEKLKKISSVKAQLMQSIGNTQQLEYLLDERVMLANQFQDFKKNLDYETAILMNMKQQRNKIKLCLKQKQENMVKEEKLKKSKIQKLQDSVLKKKLILKGIIDKIEKQDDQYIPEPLQEKLQKKLEEFEQKFSYLNIIEHEKTLEKRRLQDQISQIQFQQKFKEQSRQKKQKQEERQFQMMQNHYLIKQMEEEKLKKLCGVNEISEIAEDTFKYDQEALQQIKNSIQKQISSIEKQNKKLLEETNFILEQKNNQNPLSVKRKQKQLEEEKVQLRRLKLHYEKKNKLLVEWEAVIEQMTGESCSQNQMSSKLKSFSKKMEMLVLKEQKGIEGNKVNNKSKINILEDEV